MGHFWRFIPRKTGIEKKCFPQVFVGIPTKKNRRGDGEVFPDGGLRVAILLGRECVR
jgi:hypothetical protein